MSKRKELIKCIEIVVLSLAFFALSVTYGGISYETNDDTIINLIAAGAYGEPSQYLVHSGIVFGYILKFLYFLFPTINCYLWWYLFFNFLSVIFLCMVLTEKLEPGSAAGITILINVLLAKDYYIEIQYTKSTAIYAATGIVLLLSIVWQKKIFAWKMIVGSLFLTVGLSSRMETVIQVAPLAFIAAFFVYGAGIRSRIKEIKARGEANALKKEVGAAFAKLILPIVMLLFVIGTNYVAFDMNSKWNEYYQWDAIMVQKRDYGNYNFEWFQDEYLANGFTEWDFKLIDEWMWNDCDNFTLEKMQLMADIGSDIKMNRLRFDTELVGQTWDIVLEALRGSNIPYALIIITILSIALCCAKRQWWSILGILLINAGAVFELYYLACLRRSVWRVEYGIWFAAGCFVLALMIGVEDRGEKSDEKPFVITAYEYVALICVLLVAFIWQRNTLDYSHTSWSEKDVASYEHIKSINNTDGIFVMSINEMYGGLNHATNIWDINKRDYAGFYENIISSGNWPIPSPIGMYYANVHGIQNVFKSFVDRDDVYYIGGGETAGYIYVYLNEKYGPGIGMRDVTFDWGTAWQFYRE